MIVKSSIKGDNILCDCCNKEYSHTVMKHYVIGAFKSFTLCKDCEKQLINVSNIDTIKKVISIEDNIYY